MESNNFEILKNRYWHSDFKEYYTPEDVLRYLDKVEHEKSMHNFFNIKGVYISGPENLFTKEVFKKGLDLSYRRELANIEFGITRLNERREELLIKLGIN